MLKKDFHILEAFATGSIPRYTALKGYADLDIIVVLHYGKHTKGRLPSSVLQEVRDSLSGYITNVRKNGQAVTMYYKSWPSVDIVPATRIIDSIGNFVGYEIPNMTTEEWIYSKPKKHSKNMSTMVSICGSNFKQVITMIKWWNKKHGNYLQSYHIEVIALKAYLGLLSDMPWDVFLYFEKACELISNPLWYEESFVDSYLTYTNRLEVEKRLQTARDIARNAWHETYNANNNHEKGISKWRQIFGQEFPAYG